MSDPTSIAAPPAHPPAQHPPLPWATLLVAVMALWVAASGPLETKLILARDAVGRGEIWRLWTGNWVHFGASHLAWNLVVLVPAGIWLEQLAPGRARWLFGLAPGIIGVAVLFLDPTLSRYGGLSGVAAGVLTLLALVQISRRSADRWFWWAVLALLVLKIGGESLAGHSLFAEFDDPKVRAVPVAHVAGMVTALVVHLGARRI